MIDKIKNHPLFPTVLQFLRFGLVGLSNTAISYGMDMLGYYVIFKDSGISEGAKVVIVSALSFIVSTVNSYIWNSRFVFTVDGRLSFAQHILRYLRMALCYALTGLVLSPLMKLGLGRLDVPFWAASILTLVVTIPLNFYLNRRWAFHGDKPSPDRK